MKNPASWLMAMLASVLTLLLVNATSLPGVNSTLQTVFTYGFELSSDKPTYSATTGAFTIASSPQDVCAIQGSATKLIRVRRLWWSATSTSAAQEPVDIYFRTASATDGTGVIVSGVKYDTSVVAPTGRMEKWTANPTPGAGSVLWQDLMSYNAITTANVTASPPMIEFGRAGGQAIILRGLAQSLVVNLNGTTLTGGTGYCTFEWTEE